MRVKNLNLCKCPIQMKPGDQDGDGRVGYHDLAWLVKAMEDRELPEEAFDNICETVGAINKLLTKDQLYAWFESEVEDEDVMEAMEETLDKLTAFEKVESQDAHTHARTHRHNHTHTHAHALYTYQVGVKLMIYIRICA